MNGYLSTFEPDDPDSRTNGDEPASLSGKSVRNGDPDEHRTPPVLALHPNILGRFRADLRRAGVAGEETLATITFLALTSRVLPWGKPTERPISLIAKGTSSTGKSHAIRSTLRFVPPSAYIDLGSMSRRYLFYSEEGFEHRFVVIPEWASIKDDDELVALVRVLLSEGRIVHGTVDVDRTARLIEKAGPTGLLVTTTEAAVDPEMETRCLTIVTDDSPEQTRRVFGVLAELERDAEPVDLQPWHDLQDWIASRDTRVEVPFVAALAATMPITSTRLRRDFSTVVSLVRAHALLYQAQRETNGRGRIVATIQGDYSPVRDLVGPLIAQGVEAGVSPTIRETVEAVREVLGDRGGHASPTVLIERLGVGRSAAYDRIRRALAAGYLDNLALRHERAMRLVLGAALPGENDFLPTPGQLVQHTSGRPAGHGNALTMRDSAVLSGSPPRPAAEREPGGDCSHPVVWLARDGTRRCRACEPPAFPDEVVTEATPAADGPDEDEIERLAALAREWEAAGE